MLHSDQSVLIGDVREQLATLPAESVQACITSPPYFGLRAYSTAPQVWGGDPEHGHTFMPSGSCPHCGAWRGELGSEPTPSLFIEHLVSIFDEVARVMRPDACLFVNLGDSYAGSGKGPTGKNGIGDQSQRQGFHDEHKYSGVKAKSLLLIPERFALAMQDAGWIVRSRIAWCKTSAMPESVRDRPTSAWEVILMFTKQARYFYDADAVRQPHADSTVAMVAANKNGTSGSAKGRDDLSVKQIAAAGGWSDAPRVLDPRGANLRNFWLLGPEPSKEQHYAAFVSELPRRCILAATSERGQCPACGAPWVRQTTSRIEYTQRVHNHQKYGDAGQFGHMAANRHRDGHIPGRKISDTTGWQAGCTCEAGDPVPQLVLDPFLGSGTTLVAARHLGRSGVGIELNSEYAEIAQRRIRTDTPSWALVDGKRPKPIPSDQLDLFGDVAS